MFSLYRKMNAVLVLITLFSKTIIVWGDTPLTRSGADLRAIPGENAAVNSLSNAGWGQGIRPSVHTSAGAALGTHPAQRIGTPFGQGTPSEFGQEARTGSGPGARTGLGLSSLRGVGLGAHPDASIGGGSARGNPVPGTLIDAGISKDSRVRMISRDGKNAEVNIGGTGVLSLGKGTGAGVVGGMNLGASHAAVLPAISGTRVNIGLGGAFQKTNKNRKRPATGGAGPLSKAPHMVGCPTKGYNNPPGLYKENCVCNFAGACDFQNVPLIPKQPAPYDTKNLPGFAPTGIDKFALDGPRVGTVCEKGTVATLFDCNAHISLYAATVIHGSFVKG